MSDDALFQLGMDLDRGSSTAQTEEKLSRCRSSQEDERKDFSVSVTGFATLAPISSSTWCERNGSTI